MDLEMNIWAAGRDGQSFTPVLFQPSAVAFCQVIESSYYAKGPTLSKGLPRLATAILVAADRPSEERSDEGSGLSGRFKGHLAQTKVKLKGYSPPTSSEEAPSTIIPSQTPRRAGPQEPTECFVTSVDCRSATLPAP